MLPKDTLTFLGRLVQSLLARGKSGGDCVGHSFFSNWLKLGSTQRQTWEKRKSTQLLVTNTTLWAMWLQVHRLSSDLTSV